MTQSLRLQRHALAIATLASLTPLVPAQGLPNLLDSFPGSAAKAWSGHSVSSLADIDGDSIREIVIGEPGDATTPGRVIVRSGNPANPGILLTIPGNTQDFGWVVADAGDVNGDGKHDIIVGDPNGIGFSVKGFVHIVSGATGAILKTHAGGWDNMNTLPYGDVVAGVGDTNSDGYDDYAFRVRRLTATGYAQAVWIWSGGPPSTFGTLLVEVLNTGGLGADFGAAIASIRDVTLDGRKDFVVGGAATRIYDATSGALVVTAPFPAKALAAVPYAGDVIDAFDEIAVGDWTNNGNRGVVTLLDGATLLPRWSATGTAIDDHLGRSLGAVQDFDDDLRYEVVIGVPQPGLFIPKTGFVSVRGGNDGCELARFTGAGPRDQFGLSVATIGDYGGNYRDDILIGAPFAGTSDSGEAYVYETAHAGAALGTNYCFCPAPGTCGNGHNDASGCHNSVTSAAGLPGGGKLGLFGSASVSADNLFLFGSDLRPNKLVTGIYGNSMAPVPFNDGQRCVSAPFFRLPTVTVNGIGEVVIGPCITSTLHGGLAAGSTVNFQLFYRDGGGPCNTGANLTNAVVVTLQP